MGNKVIPGGFLRKAAAGKRILQYNKEIHELDVMEREIRTFVMKIEALYI